ncbi:bifunctional glycosyl transferase/transpeptidase [Zophobihabitans entericus]|uniref:Penicillin-binding protein 1B n=1 Tax=Zophobihabitans entericus TaxID=1635327 RepID=A0A6G9IB92_9GAMM|nr:bifunctional glycosyl transferase/transpeptidase [Zophobihabitans entericus]QIQ21089.1 bifunctional glycosyl transferase/transpeptidase [Zophobihabitans entericus]
MKKQTVKSSSRTKPAKKPAKRSFKRRVGYFLLKVFLIIAAITIIYGIYLDQKIKERIDGKVWELPAAVYGQIVNLEPGSAYTQDDLISILNGAQYRQVLTATRPGEFVVVKNAIEIYRRPFIFPDGEEKAFRARITFTNNQISQIHNIETGRNFGLFRIDPKLITMMRSANGEQRLFVPLKNYPEFLIKTLIATEDRRFYEHDGISLYSIGRAIVTNFSSGRTVQGGSTLTQQLVKNLFLTNERSYIRKIREAYMSIILDARYSKERILELYLNEVYLGQSGDEEIHGFPLASLYYFGRPVDELTLDQQALLVGMVKGASYYNPWSKPERAIERRNVVLKLLEQQELIDPELYELLSKRPLAVLPKGGVISPQPGFMQLVRRELRQKLGDQADNLSGMKIFTTFDPVAQDAAERSVVDHLEALRQSRNQADLEAAMVIIDRQTGEIRAVIGGSQPQYAGFNRALLARRPIGSLIKPATYLTALSNPDRYRLNTWLDDKPLSIRLDSKTVWEPKNFDKQYRNQVMIVDALAYSLNIPAVNLGMELGMASTENTLKSMGVPGNVIKSVPARFLGSIELTPLEVAQMYQVIANNGQQSPLSVLRFVMGEKGETVYQSYPQAHQAVSAQAAYLTLFAMQQVVEYGTAKSLNQKFSQYQLAAKTGSTNDLRDSWFTGVDGKEIAVVWVGLDNHQPMQLTGSTGALTIYREYLNNHPPQRLTPVVPPNIQRVGVTRQGDWACSGPVARTLPVWSSNIQALCAGRPQAEPQPESRQSEEAPDWLKELFSQ